MSVISGVVPTKTTGQIDETGGSLSLAERFPENLIDRNSNPSCLDSTFADYGVVKGSEHVPDIASHLNHRHAFKAASHCAKKGKHQIATLGFPLSFFFIGHLFQSCNAPGCESPRRRVDARLRTVHKQLAADRFRPVDVDLNVVY